MEELRDAQFFQGAGGKTKDGVAGRNGSAAIFERHEPQHVPQSCAHPARTPRTMILAGLVFSKRSQR
ncbi:hypothetical protein [Polyangium jinanense]|uniref:Uncharacterized protein n=1 Tax=Polyangium jinanense TaxID=2829994 RepID=A0A9X3XBH5_9BACT|nr:hypothetical protein [Polyangium jinanense]MDC3957524.1 hypothetical protein [Polyangium jinanense]MDC3984986.1 hypothetical protein [Polyangium jinanense]